MMSLVSRLVPDLRSGIRTASAVLAIALAIVPTAQDAQAETARVVLQYGISYLPLSVMQAQKFWERRAKELGLDLEVEWKNLGNGGALNDAILTGAADLAAGGLAPMLKLWDRTQKNVKVRGIAALDASPSMIVTNRPDIKSLRDFKPDDKIAVAIPKVSIQAVVLQMAAAQAFGAEKFGFLDAQTVAMKHPDAVAALLSPRPSIAAYVGSSPYQEQVLKNPGVHKVVDTFELMGGPVTFSAVWSASGFVEKRPLAYKSFLLALDDAMQRIAADKAAAVDDYIRVTNTPETERADLLEIVRDPRNVYSTVPQSTAKFADFLATSGFLETRPASWKDYFFEGLHGAHGS